jgi:peptidoglycan/xylan/chitin deacetylase (PgdA/CDA1 family)
VPRRALGLLLCLLAAAPAASARPTIVSLEFDDGTADQAQALPLLAAHGFKAAFFVNSAHVGRTGYLTWSRLAAIQRGGHEIAGHTLHHVRLTTLSAARARHEVCDDRAALRAHGFAATDFAYPYGATTPALERIVRACGYSSGRRISGAQCPGCPFAESVPPRDPFATRTPPAVLARDAPTILRRKVAGAQGHGGGWVQLVFHHVCSGCGTYAITRAHLAGFLGWLAHRRGVEVRLVSSML